MDVSKSMYENILVSQSDGVGTITLHRPKALNALSHALSLEVLSAVEAFDADEAIGCIVITGSERAFAAGADIKEMAELSAVEAYSRNHLAHWDRLTRCRKPVIAAVAGYALGGGCEVAMMCDFIIAADTAKFGQPEITIGTIPGMGGSQRLMRAVGKSKAMEMCLSGRTMDAQEAERAGLVSRVVPAAELLSEVQSVAKRIASLSHPVVAMAKEAVNAALETSLAEGVHRERRLFHATFATADQKEGMAAFQEKRAPAFCNR